MNISTADDFIGVLDHHPDGEHSTILGYADGAITRLPHGLFKNWRGHDLSDRDDLTFGVGKGTLIGIGSVVKLTLPQHVVTIGNWCALGQRTQFVLGSTHRTHTAGISDFSLMTEPQGLVKHPWAEIRSTTITIGHDVWLGDDVMLMNGVRVGTGAVIGARSLLTTDFIAEPYGVYVGTPARLVRFRFSEPVREALLDLAWWEMPVSWMAAYNELFMTDLTADEGQALEAIAAMRERRDAWLPL